MAGSPTGHLHVFSVNSIKLILLAVFSIWLTLAKASGLISLAEGCGGKGWPAGMILRTAGGVIRTVSAAATGLGAVLYTYLTLPADRYVELRVDTGLEDKRCEV